MATKLEILADQYRKIELGRNSFNYSNEYSSTNRDAISDGDEFGKGQSASGSVGSATDISVRNESYARNRFNQTNEYSSINRDAISDGDEKGKGESGNGDVGSLTDINIRTQSIVRNQFGSSHTYPDF